MKTIKFSDIQPVGNFKEVLESLTDKLNSIISECEKRNEYNKSLANFLKFIYGDMDFASVLEEGIETNNIWCKDEALIDLLCVHILGIRANSTAHRFLNNIPEEDVITALNNYIVSKSQESNIYKNIKIVK